MPAGKYQDRVTWLQQSEVKDAHHTVKETFTPNGSLWASVEVSDSAEPKEDGRLKSVDRATIYIHNLPDISRKDRLEDRDGNVWKIIGLKYEANELVITAETV